MFVESVIDKKHFPASLTEAYIKALSKAIKQEISRKERVGCSNVRLDNFPSLRKCNHDLAVTIANVSRLAFDSLVACHRHMNSNITTKRKRLRLHVPQMQFSDAKLHSYLPSGDNYGLLSPRYHKDEYGSLVGSFSFPHLVIQEFWAAFHVLITKLSISDFEDHILVNHDSKFIYFVCGLYSHSNTIVHQVLEISFHSFWPRRILNNYVSCGIESGHSIQSLADKYLKQHGTELMLDHLPPFSHRHVQLQSFLSVIHLNITHVFFSPYSPSMRLYMKSKTDVFPNLYQVNITVPWREALSEENQFAFIDNLKLVFSRQRILPKLIWIIPVKVLIDQNLLNCLGRTFDAEIEEMEINVIGSIVEMPKYWKIYESKLVFLTKRLSPWNSYIDLIQIWEYISFALHVKSHGGRIWREEYMCNIQVNNTKK